VYPASIVTDFPSHGRQSPQACCTIGVTTKVPDCFNANPVSTKDDMATASGRRQLSRSALLYLDITPVKALFPSVKATSSGVFQSGSRLYHIPQDD
jgi:hypothetical protein